MKIDEATTYKQLAFIVCTVLDEADVTAILTGGGAATIYAPDAYQSRDLDFVLDFWSGISAVSAEPLLKLGFLERGQSYVHPNSPFTLDFPPGPLAIGEENIHTWDTLRDGRQILNILSPTDCVRDRLAWYLFSNDFSALEQALAVAKIHSIDMEVVEKWCVKEGQPEKFRIFEYRVGLNS